jgi:hypothetical protein
MLPLHAHFLSCSVNPLRTHTQTLFGFRTSLTAQRLYFSYLLVSFPTWSVDAIASEFRTATVPRVLPAVDIPHYVIYWQRRTQEGGCRAAAPPPKPRN